MGDVYRAHDSSLNRDVAIEVLPEDLADDLESSLVALPNLAVGS